MTTRKKTPAVDGAEEARRAIPMEAVREAMVGVLAVMAEIPEAMGVANLDGDRRAEAMDRMVTMATRAT